MGRYLLMPYASNKHHRGSIRLKGYDYTQVGAYFVTIVTRNRACLFGEVAGDDMRLNDAGEMVHRVWDELATFYPGVQTDAFVVMPNHIHGIIVLTANANASVGAGPRACPFYGQSRGDIGQPQGGCPYREHGDNGVYRATTGGCPYRECGDDVVGIAGRGASVQIHDN